MPRGERPPAAGEDVVLRLAADLRALRRSAGNPTYRGLSSRAHFSISTLSSAANGRRLASLDVTLAYVRACGGDLTAWERRWHEAAIAHTAGDTVPDAVAPYVGLAAYQVQDAKQFHGRDRTVDELTARMRRQRFVAVIGASGIGKSSLLRAGLAARWEVGPTVVLTPGPHPVEELAVRMVSLTGTAVGRLHADFTADRRNLSRTVRVMLAERSDEVELLSVVDQFEEVFTLCRNESERARFLDLLLTASGADSRCRVVLGVRADFYDHYTRHPELAAALADAQVRWGR